ncbi:MAG: hypothetical protein GQ570_13375 [Helicobacteraceae bacterium]|nr:hypothetical protein [Helicobacteraceae bacterium]
MRLIEQAKLIEKKAQKLIEKYTKQKSDLVGVNFSAGFSEEGMLRDLGDSEVLVEIERLFYTLKK